MLLGLPFLNGSRDAVLFGVEFELLMEPVDPDLENVGAGVVDTAPFSVLEAGEELCVFGIEIDGPGEPDTWPPLRV